MMPIATILALLQVAAVLLPELETALPVIERALAGKDVTAADITALDTTIQALNAKAVAA